MKWRLTLKPYIQIIKRIGIDENGDVQRFLRDECDRFMDAYIPMESGILKNTKTYPNNHEIKYTSPYAHYMYKGVVYISPTLGVSGIPLKNGKWWSPKGEKKLATNKPLKYSGAPKRGKEWDKRMKSDRKNDIKRDLQNYIKGK